MGSDHIIDGVHTYLAKYYLDLWFLGIFLINYVWGVISGYLSSGNRMVSRFLTSSILLGALTFIFFVDYLTVLTVVMELIAVAFIQHYSVQEKVCHHRFAIEPNRCGARLILRENATIWWKRVK